MRDRPRAHTHARTRAARKWKTSMHEDGVDARVRGITPLASRVSFFFFCSPRVYFDRSILGRAYRAIFLFLKMLVNW